MRSAIKRARELLKSGKKKPRLDGGKEILDKTPVAVPLGFKHPEPLSEQIRRMVMREVSDLAHSQGFESLEESEDFDIDDDMEPFSVHEMDEKLEGHISHAIKNRKKLPSRGGSRSPAADKKPAASPDKGDDTPDQQ